MYQEEKISHLPGKYGIDAIINPDGSFRIIYTGKDSPDFETITKKTLDINLAIFAKTIEGGSYGLIRFKTKVKITDVDEAPTGIDFIPVIQQLTEGKYEDGVKIADIKFIDDELGTNTLATLPSDSIFEYKTNKKTGYYELWLKENEKLKYEPPEQGQEHKIDISVELTGTGEGEFSQEHLYDNGSSGQTSRINV